MPHSFVQTILNNPIQVQKLIQIYRERVHERRAWLCSMLHIYCHPHRIRANIQRRVNLRHQIELVCEWLERVNEPDGISDDQWNIYNTCYDADMASEHI